MITTNVIQRTFRIKHGDGSGTAFAIDREDKQYLITARHVVKDITRGDRLSIFHHGQWKSVQVDVVGIGACETDVAVVACPMHLAPSHPLEASSAGLIYGQPIYFLGFPFGWDSGGERINRDFPIPFVKGGIVSAIITEGASRIYIDAHGNKGFSGGPVVFIPNGPQPQELRVAGIVANYPTPLLEPVVDKHRNPIVRSHNEPLAYFQENPGIVVAFDIRHATELIDANPIGFRLPGNQDS